MTRRIYAIYKDGSIKQIKTTVKAESAYEAVKWLTDHDEELKDEANHLNWQSRAIGFNLSGKISDSLKKKIVKPVEL